MVIDALGNEIVVGRKYGYSRNDGGYSHVTIGTASKITEANSDRYNPPKVRLIDCTVLRFYCGEPYQNDVKPADVSILGVMVFPVAAVAE
jgi:hypothetical protein